MVPATVMGSTAKEGNCLLGDPGTGTQTMVGNFGVFQPLNCLLASYIYVFSSDTNLYHHLPITQRCSLLKSSLGLLTFPSQVPRYRYCCCTVPCRIPVLISALRYGTPFSRNPPPAPQGRNRKGESFVFRLAWVSVNCTRCNCMQLYSCTQL